jgi:hypothetical protein
VFESIAVGTRGRWIYNECLQREGDAGLEERAEGGLAGSNLARDSEEIAVSRDDIAEEEDSEVRR